MTGTIPPNDRSGADETGTSIQVYARLTGVLLLLSLIFGYFGEAYVPSKMIARGDPTATAANIMASPFLFRLGFASYLVEALCDVSLALLFYVLLKPVRKNLALLTAFYGVPSVLRGYLIFKSGYLPKFLGVLLVIGGIGFIARNLASVLAPPYAWSFLLLPMAAAGIALTAWLLVRGVDVERWQERSATAQLQT